MLGLTAQIKAFFLTYFLGIIAGSIFHYYQLIIKNRRLGRYFLYLLDFVLWVIMIIFVFIAMVFINQGEMRVYVFIALVAGLITYYKFLARYLVSPLSFMARITVVSVKSVIFICTKPFLKILELYRDWLKRRQDCLSDDEIDPDEKIF